MKKIVKNCLLVFILMVTLKFVNVNAASFSALTTKDYCNSGEDTTIMKKIYKSATIVTSNDEKYYEFTIPARYYIAIEGARYGKYYAQGKVRFKYNDIKNKQIQIYNKQDGCAYGYIKRGTKCDANDKNISSPIENRNYSNGTSTVTITTPQGVVANVYRISNGSNKVLKKLDESDKATITISDLVNSNGDTIYVDYYGIDGTCKGRFIKTTEIVLDGYSKNKVKNDKYCIAIRKLNFYKSNPSYFPVCNAEYVDYGTEYSTADLEGLYEVLKELNNIKSEYGNKSLKGLQATKEKRRTEELYCKFNKNLNQTQEKEYVTVDKQKYYTKICKETVKIKFDTPKLVANNGGGFTYDVEVEPTVSCYVSLNEDALKKLFDVSVQKACSLKGSCYGTYDHGEFDSGPNDNFDNCVKSCDGGKYTQSCINSCYTSIYGNQKLATNNLIYPNTSNNGLLAISYTGKYAEDYKTWTNDWCSAPPKTGSGRATNNSSHGYYVANHYNPGTYQCAYYNYNDGTKNVRVNLQKYFRTYNCDSTCSYTISGNGKSFTSSLDANGKFTKSISVDEDGKVTSNGVNCYIRKNGNQITIDTSEIEKLKNTMISVGKDVEEMNEKGADYKNAKYTYTIHNSAESYCDNSNGNFVTYDNSKLSIDGNNIKTNNSKTVSSNYITMGFANTCLKDGKVNKGTGSNGCCMSSDGISGGKKFYMDVTTENNINNVYMWPTTSNANFTDDEKKTINDIRESIEEKVTGKIVVWDANKVSNNNDNIKTPKEACTKNGYKFNYNIKVNLKDLGVLGSDDDKWSFDINCFYGYYNPNMGSCGIQLDNVDTDGDGQLDTTVIKETLCNEGDPDNQKEGANTQATTLVNDYIFRTVDVTDLFNKSTERPWNWKTSETTKAATSLLSAQGKTYNIDPNTTVTNIQNTGYAYTDYRNFGFTISSTNMRNIRKYNTDHPNIATSTCTNKTVGCNNTFIKDTNYVEKATGDSGLTYNNIRDKK